MIPFLLVVRNLMALVAYGSQAFVLVLRVISLILHGRDLSRIKRLRKKSNTIIVNARVAERVDVRLAKHLKNEENVILMSYSVNGKEYSREFSLYDTIGFHSGTETELVCDPSDPKRAAFKGDNEEQALKKLIQWDISGIAIALILIAFFALPLGIKFSWEV